MEKNIAIAFVDSNLDNIIFIVAIIGVAKNAPIIPQKAHQKSNAIISINQLKFSLSHIIFGSTKFPVTNCGILRHKSINSDIGILPKVTSEYKNGSPKAIIAQTAGTKSNINTNSQNVSAKSSQNKLIIIIATIPLNKARKNLEIKYVFKSW